MRLISISTSRAAPCRYSSAKPRIVVSGVRSSWLASVMNRRIRSSERAGLLGRRLRRRHRPLDLREHSVERQRQSADFGARITFGNTTIELSGGDRRGGLLDLDQRPQAAMDHPVAGDAEHQQHRGTDADLRVDQRAHRRLHVGQVDGDGGQLAAQARAPTSPATGHASGRSSRR